MIPKFIMKATKKLAGEASDQFFILVSENGLLKSIRINFDLNNN